MLELLIFYKLATSPFLLLKVWDLDKGDRIKARLIAVGFDELLVLRERRQINRDDTR